MRGVNYDYPKGRYLLCGLTACGRLRAGRRASGSNNTKRYGKPAQSDGDLRRDYLKNEQGEAADTRGNQGKGLWDFERFRDPFRTGKDDRQEPPEREGMPFKQRNTAENQ